MNNTEPRPKFTAPYKNTVLNFDWFITAPGLIPIRFDYEIIPHRVLLFHCWRVKYSFKFWHSVYTLKFDIFACINFRAPKPNLSHANTKMYVNSPKILQQLWKSDTIPKRK